MPRSWRPTAASGQWIARHMTKAALAATLVMLAGCAGMGLPVADFNRDGISRLAADRTTTAAIASVDPSDWETVRRAVAEAITSRNTATAVNWSNPDTGSSGTIAPLLAVAAANGTCRPFSTTMSDARGVRHFRGDACRETNGRIQLVRVVADDPALI